MERSCGMLLLLVLILFISNCFPFGSGHEHALEQVPIGLVLDSSSIEGKMVEICVSMALSDFYAINSDYKTRITLYVRNSHGKPLHALASDMVQTVGVEAIIGGNSLPEAKILAEFGEEARVPVISLNSPISFSLSKYSYLIQATYDSASEAKGIAAFIHEFDWNNVSLVYEDVDDWRESIQPLEGYLHEKSVHIQSKVGLTVSSNEHFIKDRLQKMKNSGASVYVVHLSELIAAHLFPCARELGMMSEGFAWILTAKSMNGFQGKIDSLTKETMEGVVGFKSYIPMSKELHNFTWRWKKSLLHVEEISGFEITQLSISEVWAHDMAWALARSVEVARMSSISSTLFNAIKMCRFKGLSGDFEIVDNRLLADKFEIVNMIGSGERRIGFWNSNCSFSKTKTIIWPGGSTQSLKRRNFGERKTKKLRVLVTSSNIFSRLIKVETNPMTNETTAQGFCIDVFMASIRPFNYEVEYIPWRNGSNYDNLAYALSSQRDKYDVAVGDITITSNRSTYVDFTIPFTDMGIGIITPNERSSMWVFFQPLTPSLWITSATFFVLTGIIVWLIERPENTEFQGSWPQQIGVMLLFGFSTLVYAHRERLKHNLSRFVVTIWVFAVLILTSSYTATLTSIMTVQKIRFNSNAPLSISKFRALTSMRLNSSEDYAQALLKKSVTFAVDELPYLKVLLGANPGQFLLVDTQCISNGFGFMFQKGNELASNVSREISRLRTDHSLNNMEKKWFENHFTNTTGDTSNPITLYRFRGLFMITGVSFAFALAVLFILRIQDKWKVLVKSVNIFFSRNSTLQNRLN